jgi:hypothetical protein
LRLRFGCVIASTDWGKLAVLAPAFLIGGGIFLASMILLGRAFMQNFRESQHKGLIYVGLAIVLAAGVILTYLGIKLPRSE